MTQTPQYDKKVVCIDFLCLSKSLYNQPKINSVRYKRKSLLICLNS